MATGYVQLFPGGIGTDQSTDNLVADLTYEKSTGTLANAPSPVQVMLAFDGTADLDEHWTFSFIIPGDYSGSPVLKGIYKMAAGISSGNVVWKGGQASSENGVTDDDAKAFAAVATTISAVPGTQGQTKEFTLTLTATTMAASRHCVVFIGRDASDTTNDTAAGDAYLLSLVFEYTTA